MPSLDTARRIANIKNNNAKTIGQIHKENSDFVMEQTWWNDKNSKLCYIYDFAHDDQPDLNVGMTYENTTKTPIDAKIMVTMYGSLSKDQPELHCMFRPNQKTKFDKSDELYYMEEYREKYGCEDVFVGKYLDAPDKDGVYHKYLICLKDITQDFQKYFILPCDFQLNWIRKNGNTRIKQKMWCVLRSQSSYNSGLWTDYSITRMENQEILFIPTNSISDTIYYISQDDESNQRLIVDIPNYSDSEWKPNVWKVSKLERVNVRGRSRVTLYQDFYNEHTDYIEKDETGKIIGLWADYNSSTIEPTAPDTPTPSTNYGKISATSYTIKVGGSYKTLTVKVYDSSDTEITDSYSSVDFAWTCSVDNEDITSKVTWLSTSNFNQIKVKFPDEKSYLNKTLEVKCVITNDTEIIETTAQFELTI